MRCDADVVAPPNGRVTGKPRDQCPAEVGGVVVLLSAACGRPGRRESRDTRVRENLRAELLGDDDVGVETVTAGFDAANPFGTKPDHDVAAASSDLLAEGAGEVEAASAESERAVR